MPLASTIQNTKVKGQPAVRRYQRFRDQHGRRYGATIEMKTGDPLGNIDLLGWSAPWIPHQKYFEVTKDEEGNVEVGRFTINYKAQLRDAKKERKDFDDRVAFFAQAMFGEKAGEAIADPPPQLRRLLKGAPTAPEVIVAAMKGDRWLLGLEQGECPEYLRPYFAGKIAVEELGGDEIELDPEFIEKMEAAFEAARIKGTQPTAELADLSERARAAQEKDDQRAAARVRGGSR